MTSSLLVCSYLDDKRLQNYEVQLSDLRLSTLELYRVVEDAITSETGTPFCVTKVLIYDDARRIWDVVHPSHGIRTTFPNFSQIFAIRNDNVITPPIRSIPAPIPARVYNSRREGRLSIGANQNPILCGDKYVALWVFLLDLSSKNTLPSSGGGTDAVINQAGLTAAFTRIGLESQFHAVPSIFGRYTTTGVYWSRNDLNRFIEEFPEFTDAMHERIRIIVEDEKSAEILLQTRSQLCSKQSITLTLLKQLQEVNDAMVKSEREEEDILSQLDSVVGSALSDQLIRLAEAEVRLQEKRSHVYRAEDSFFAQANRYDKLAASVHSPMRSIRVVDPYT